MNAQFAFENTNFFNLSTDEMMLIEGGNLLRNVYGVVGGVIGGVAAFVGTAAACSTVLTPLGGAIVGATAIPGGAAVGAATGLAAYDFLAGK